MNIIGSIAVAFATTLLSISQTAQGKILHPQPPLGESEIAVDSQDNPAAPLEKTIEFGEIKAAQFVEEVPKKTPNFPAAGSGFLGAPQYVVEIAQASSNRTGMPIALIIAQLKKESNFNPKAVSRTNDHGIAQIHFPKPGVTLEQAYDPSFAINWLADKMTSNFRTYGNWRDSLAAYNAGAGGRERGLGYGYADLVLRMAGI